MKILRLFDRTLLKFLLVGVANTLFSAAIMFVLYNVAHFGYWGSSAAAYVLASILSFCLNRRFTFQSRAPLLGSAVRFSINVAVCYLMAYSAAQPLVSWALGGSGLSQSMVEQLAMLVGMCVFTGLNYLGQRFFAFRSRGEHEG